MQSAGKEQQYIKREDLKRFWCGICRRSFQLEVNSIRHHKIHRSQKELESLPPVQNSNAVKIPNSETIKHLIEPSNADSISQIMTVKPEGCSEFCSDYNGSLPQDVALITSGERSRGKPAVLPASSELTLYISAEFVENVFLLHPSFR